MSLENRGIPTVVVCTAPFLDSALIHAKAFGRPGFQPIIIPHPLGGLASERVLERAHAVEADIVAALTAGH